MAYSIIHYDSSNLKILNNIETINGEFISNGKNVKQTEKDAKQIFPIELWNELHLQIIWYGREYSPARGWNLEKDLITKTIGRKSILKEYIKKQAQ